MRRKKKAKKERILDKLTKEQLLDLVKFWEELATEKHSKYEIQKELLKKRKRIFHQFLSMIYVFFLEYQKLIFIN